MRACGVGVNAGARRLPTALAFAQTPATGSNTVQRRLSTKNNVLQATAGFKPLQRHLRRLS